MELKPAVYEVVKNSNSTDDCKRDFNEFLEAIIKAGPDYIKQNFAEIRRAIAGYVGKLGDKASDAKYKSKLERLAKTIASLDVKEGLQAIAWARSMLKANIPELFVHEQESSWGVKLKAKLVPIFTFKGDLMHVLKSILEENQTELIRMGKQLDLARKMKYYSAIVDEMPDNDKLVEKYVECVYYGDLENEFVADLETEEKAVSKRYCIELYGDIVRSQRDKRNNIKQLRLACLLLKPYLDTDENRELFQDLAEMLSRKMKLARR